MGVMKVVIPVADGKTVKLTIPQVMTLSRLMKEFPGSFWHQQSCECCVCLHPCGDETVGFIVDEDGDAAFLTKEDLSE